MKRRSTVVDCVLNANTNDRLPSSYILLWSTLNISCLTLWNVLFQTEVWCFYVEVVWFVWHEWFLPSPLRLVQVQVNFRNGINWTSPFLLNIRNAINWAGAFSKAFSSSEALISVLSKNACLYDNISNSFQSKTLYIVLIFKWSCLDTNLWICNSCICQKTCQQNTNFW